jgi:hypothetical protein
MATSDPVTLAELPVMYVESPNGLAGAKTAFDRLESKFPTLRGRKFYGTFLPPDGPYRACVAIEPGDDPTALGLPTWTIPGGKYNRGKLLNWQEHMPEIGKTFSRLSEGGERDPNRPGIEFYRSATELVLFLPMK